MYRYCFKWKKKNAGAVLFEMDVLIMILSSIFYIVSRGEMNNKIIDKWSESE